MNNGVKNGVSKTLPDLSFNVLTQKCSVVNTGEQDSQAIQTAAEAFFDNCDAVEYLFESLNRIIVRLHGNDNLIAGH